MSRVLYLLSYAAVTLYKLSESGKRVKSTLGDVDNKEHVATAKIMPANGNFKYGEETVSGERLPV